MTTYTPNIPQPGDIPAQSQDQILQNFQSIDDGTNGFARNHVSLTNGTVGQRGKHNFLELVQQSGKPGTLAANENTFYAKSVTSTGDGGYTQTETFLARGTSAVEIQMTAGKNSDVPFSDADNFVTFLPGGLLIQGGVVTSPGSSGTISFSPTFSAVPLSITLTAQRNSSSNPIVAWVDNASAPSASQFKYNSDVSSISKLYWVAIGLA